MSTGVELLTSPKEILANILRAQDEYRLATGSTYKRLRVRREYYDSIIRWIEKDLEEGGIGVEIYDEA